MISMPTIVLFFQENGLSMMEIFVLQSVFSAMIVLCEIPSGYFADRVGRRSSLVIGCCGAFIAFGFYSFAYGFWLIFIAEVVLGIGYAFVSGADSAILYDTLTELDQTDTYKKHEGRMIAISTFSEGIASIAAGFVALISLRSPIVAQAIVTFFTIPLALSLREPLRHMGSPEQALWNMRTIVMHTLHRHSILKWLIINYAIISTLGLIVVWFRQPYLQELNIPLEYFGFIWAGLMFVVSIASLLADAFERYVGRSVAFASLLVLTLLGFSMLGVSISFVGIVGMAVLAFMRGLQEPIMKDYVQRYVSADIRATVLSIKGFAARGLFVILGPLAGWVSDVYTLQFALIACGCFALVLGLSSLLMLRRYESQVA